MNSGSPDMAAGVAGLFVCILVPIIVLIGLAAFAFWIWMIIDVIRREFRDSNEKIIWALVVILLQALGALIYFFAGRPRGTLPSRPA